MLVFAWEYGIIKFAPYLDQSFGKVMSMLDLLQYCNQWQIPIEKTRSRSEGMEEPCGHCSACENRNNAIRLFESIQSSNEKISVNVDQSNNDVEIITPTPSRHIKSKKKSSNIRTKSKQKKE